MSWQDQGRQYHEEFRHGTAPPKFKMPAEKAADSAPDSPLARLTAVIHGAIGALKHPLRARAGAQLLNGVLPLLTEAMNGWAQGSQLDAPSFAHHFFHRDADDPVVTSLRNAAVGAKTATSPLQLAAASEQLANAMTIVGLDRWARFVAHAVERVRDSTTIAAVAKSLQPIPAASTVGGKSGSGSVGSGTRLAVRSR